MYCPMSDQVTQTLGRDNPEDPKAPSAPTKSKKAKARAKAKEKKRSANTKLPEQNSMVKTSVLPEAIEPKNIDKQVEPSSQANGKKKEMKQEDFYYEPKDTSVFGRLTKPFRPAPRSSYAPCDWGDFGGIQVTKEVTVVSEPAPEGFNKRFSQLVFDDLDEQEADMRFGTTTTCTAQPMPPSAFQRARNSIRKGLPRSHQVMNLAMHANSPICPDHPTHFQDDHENSEGEEPCFSQMYDAKEVAPLPRGIQTYEATHDMFDQPLTSTHKQELSVPRTPQESFNYTVDEQENQVLNPVLVAGRADKPQVRFSNVDSFFGMSPQSSHVLGESEDEATSPTRQSVLLNSSYPLQPLPLSINKARPHPTLNLLHASPPSTPTGQAVRRNVRESYFTDSTESFPRFDSRFTLKYSSILHLQDFLSFVFHSEPPAEYQTHPSVFGGDIGMDINKIDWKHGLAMMEELAKEYPNSIDTLFPVWKYYLELRHFDGDLARYRDDRSGMATLNQLRYPHTHPYVVCNKAKEAKDDEAIEQAFQHAHQLQCEMMNRREEARQIQQRAQQQAVELNEDPYLNARMARPENVKARYAVRRAQSVGGHSRSFTEQLDPTFNKTQVRENVQLPGPETLANGRVQLAREWFLEPSRPVSSSNGSRRVAMVDEQSSRPVSSTNAYRRVSMEGEPEPPRPASSFDGSRRVELVDEQSSRPTSSFPRSRPVTVENELGSRSPSPIDLSAFPQPPGGSTQYRSHKPFQG